MKKNGTIFYGWWIVLVGFLIMTFIFAPIANLVSLFTLPVTKELGFSSSQFMLYFTIMALSGIVVNPLAGQLIKKMDIRSYLTIFIMIAALSFIGFSISTKLIHFYLFSVLMGIGMTGGAGIPVSVLITNWFNEKRGLCLGIALAGSGFGGVILSPLVNWLITAYSWRTAYLVLGIIIAVMLIPLSIFVVKFSPADKGLTPLGEAISLDHAEGLSGPTFRQTLKSISFWTLGLGILIGGIVVNAMLLNLVPYLTEIGTSAKTAALLLSLGSAMVIFSKVLVGRLFDKMGSIPTVFIISAGSLISFLFLMKANIVSLAILYTIFSGIGSTAITVTPAFMTGALFGEREYGAKYGIVAIFISLGSAITPIVSSLIYNINHSYGLLLNTLIILAIVQFGLFFIASKTRPLTVVNSDISNKEAV
ncbi:MFS transporter [Bacillus sp. 1P06AnD]|uniref:MFS transporter n=1 Tax=Bacillus sp. 1P06AnD TaxID=3132208 RepID=UPI0039A28942